MKTYTPLVAIIALSLPASFVVADNHATPADTSDAVTEKSKKKKMKHQFEDLSVDDLKAAIDAGNVTILDANGPDKYKAGHVPGALSIHEVKATLAESLPEDKAALIVAYCGGPT